MYEDLAEKFVLDKAMQDWLKDVNHSPCRTWRSDAGTIEATCAGNRRDEEATSRMSIGH
jgi:hypothetical protein